MECKKPFRQKPVCASAILYMCTQNLLRHEVKKGNVRGAGVQAVVKRKNYSSPLFIKTQWGISSQAQKTVRGGIQGVTLPAAFSRLSLLPPFYFNLLSGAVPAGFNWKCPAVFPEIRFCTEPRSKYIKSKSEPRELNHIPEQSSLICRECFCKRWGGTWGCGFLSQSSGNWGNGECVCNSPKLKHSIQWINSWFITGSWVC